MCNSDALRNASIGVIVAVFKVILIVYVFMHIQLMTYPIIYTYFIMGYYLILLKNIKTSSALNK